MFGHHLLLRLGRSFIKVMTKNQRFICDFSLSSACASSFFLQAYILTRLIFVQELVNDYVAGNGPLGIAVFTMLILTFAISDRDLSSEPSDIAFTIRDFYKALFLSHLRYMIY